MTDYFTQVQRLQELGPRGSGTDAHRALIQDVEQELSSMGYEVHHDPHSFERWDAAPERIGLTVDGRPVATSSAWPYSGETPLEGVTAPLTLIRGRRRRWSKAAGKIAVIEMRNIEVPASLVVDSWDGTLPVKTVSNPVIGSELGGTDLSKARDAGVRAVIAVWRDLPDAVARGQYLPFIRGYQGIPALWVPESEAATLIASAKSEATATLVLAATKTPNATMDTLWAVSPGSGEDAHEAILVVTHSDGGNAVEENGHIGLLALARDAAAVAHNRTVIFVYTAGHLRIPAVTTHGQATTSWLETHPDLWAPGGEFEAVAGLAIEHLGAKEFATDLATGGFGPTGEAEPELLYATTDELAALVRRTWIGVDQTGHPVKPSPLVHLGEGEPLFEHRIPAIALVTGPLYLLAETGADVVDIELLARQIDSFRRLQEHLLGSVDCKAFGEVKLPTKLRKLAAEARALRYLICSDLRRAWGGARRD